MNRYLNKAVSLAIGLIALTATTSVFADSVYLMSSTPTHAFVIHPDTGPVAPGIRYDFVASPSPLLTFNGSDWSNSTTAKMVGRIQHIGGSTIFDVEMNFIDGKSKADWVSGGGDIKNENSSSAANVNDWRFFVLDTSVGVNNLYTTVTGGAETTYPLTLLPVPNMKLGFQVGIGASMKLPNNILGASAWIISPDDDHGDINIVLDRLPDPVIPPIPSPTAALSGIVLFGCLGLLRRRRQ